MFSVLESGGGKERGGGWLSVAVAEAGCVPVVPGLS